MRHFDFDQLKVLIIASPGFTKEAVHTFLLEEAIVREFLALFQVSGLDSFRFVMVQQRQGNKSIIAAKSKFLLLHSPTHHVHSLTEILSSPEVSLLRVSVSDPFRAHLCTGIDTVEMSRVGLDSVERHEIRTRRIDARQVLQDARRRPSEGVVL